MYLATILRDTACSNSWVSDSLSARLSLQGTTLKSTVKGVKREELIDTKVVQLTVIPHKKSRLRGFHRTYLYDGNINVCSDIIDVKFMQETYPNLAVLYSVNYSYAHLSLFACPEVGS